jgi:hypothetical protein
MSNSQAMAALQKRVRIQTELGSLRRFRCACGITETVRTTKNTALYMEIKLITNEDAGHQTSTG